MFDPELVRRNLDGLVERCGLAWDDFLALGKVEPSEKGFGLTPFALRTSQYANAVSELHGSVSREMWHGLWPEQRVDQVPITSVTNGVHQRTWISDDLEVQLGDTDPQFERARTVAAAELWAAHRNAKQRLFEFVAATRGVRELDPEILTIGFARRFATYKRASLLFSRPERLALLLADPERPIQVLVAGKAHPADEDGKDLIQLVVDFARETAAGRVVFLEDYEMTLARRLVQGVDVWLNTPRRPFEASGTSGMKAALNGVLNCSILDGWWAEAYSPDCGFAIGGAAEEDATEAEQDEADAAALYAVLEEHVLPAYYERDESGLPQRWIALMRESIAELGPRFGTARMAAEYVERLYLPAHEDAPQAASRVA